MCSRPGSPFITEFQSSLTILDALDKVEGFPSKRPGGIGYRSDYLFSQPAQIPSTNATTSSENKAWIAPSTARRQAARAAKHAPNHHGASLNGLSRETTFHRARGILNKLTPERFDKLSLELLNVGIDSEKTLRGLIILIFDKAVDEPKFSSLYAKLCSRLSRDAPNFDRSDSKINTFTRLLLTKCQDEFESRNRIAVDQSNISALSEEEQEALGRAKRKMLGNMRFIGELGKLELVHEGILHKCIQQLLEKKRGVSLADQAEDLECLCQILKTVGKRLDTPKAKLWMNQYFERIDHISQGNELPSRIRCLLQDAIELRDNNWEPRRIAREMTPQTIGQIRQAFAPPPQPKPLVEMSVGFGRSSSVPDNVGLIDIFGSPMTKKLPASPSSGSSTGLQVNGDRYRPASPLAVGRNTYMTSKQELLSRTETDKPEVDMYSSLDREMSAVGLGRREYRESRDVGGGGGTVSKGRDLMMPKFTTKNTAALTGDKLFLRPGGATNASLKPSSPHQLPKSARSSNVHHDPAVTSGQPAKDSPIFTKPAEVIIKTDARQKPTKKNDTKSSAGSGPSGNKQLSESAQCDKVLATTEDYWTADEHLDRLDDICQVIRELDMAQATEAKVVNKLMKQALKKGGGGSVPRLSALLVRLSSANLIKPTLVEKMVSDHVDDIDYLELSYPDLRQQLSKFLYDCIDGGVIAFSTACAMLDGGNAYPLGLILLQTLSEGKGFDWLRTAMDDNKIVCTSLLPVDCQSGVKLLEALEQHGLVDLMPKLTLQKQLWQQINDDPNPTSLYNWIKRNVGEENYDAALTDVLFKTILKYIATETVLQSSESDRTKVPDKPVLEQEKALFSKYQSLMLRFLHESSAQQLAALYSLQSFCHDVNFPKGMLLRVFMYLYDLDIIDDEVFLEWKEDINEDYPGKGKALFEVNQWLTWLEQAESESDEEANDDGDA